MTEAAVIVLASASVLGGTLAGFIAGSELGQRMERARWTGYKNKRMAANEKAIAEAKLLFSLGEIDESELETRIGHLHDWDGTDGA